MRKQVDNLMETSSTNGIISIVLATIIARPPRLLGCRPEKQKLAKALYKAPSTSTSVTGTIERKERDV